MLSGSPLNSRRFWRCRGRLRRRLRHVQLLLQLLCSAPLRIRLCRRLPQPLLQLARLLLRQPGTLLCLCRGRGGRDRSRCVCVCGFGKWRECEDQQAQQAGSKQRGASWARPACPPSLPPAASASRLSTSDSRPSACARCRRSVPPSASAASARVTAASARSSAACSCSRRAWTRTRQSGVGGWIMSRQG